MDDDRLAASAQCLRGALVLLQAPMGATASEDPAFLLGRLIAAVELQASKHVTDGQETFEAGYLSALSGPHGDSSPVGTCLRLAIKRLVLTVRQLRAIGGHGGQAARMSLTAAVMALFAEALLADDDTALDELNEPVSDAQECLVGALEQVTEMRATLDSYRQAS